MSYETKRVKLIQLIAQAKDRGDWYEVKMIQSIMRKADEVSKVDARHANGILERLLKSEFCTYLTEDEK
jgi:hypothetical protein